MNPITKAAFARHGGFSPQYVNEQIRKDPYLIDLVNHNGKEQVDLDGDATILFLDSHSKNKLKESSPKEHENTPPLKTKETKNTTETVDARSEKVRKKYGTEEKHILEKQKLVENIDKLRIDNEKKRGSLIPKILIERVFSRLYSIDENQFKALGINVSPKISAVYNSANTDKTKLILGLIKKESDIELKKEINKILNAGEPDRILEMNKILEDATGGILSAIKREFDKFLKNIKKLEE